MLAALALAASVASPPEALPRVERTVFLMGTRLDVAVEGATREAAVAASEAALVALEEAEARLSTWTETSELAALNRAPVGHVFPLSPDLRRELGAAVACSAATEGGFDPSIGPLLEAWGVREGGRQPATADLERALSAVGLSGLELRPDGVAVRHRPELRLEEGGFGKGAGLDRAIERLAATPGAVHGYFDFGGQVTLWTASGADAAAPIGVSVADPERRDEELVAIAVARGSISTTGNSERGLTVGGRRLSHVLDPRTGLPAEDIGSVTVWAPGALEADCLSTGLYVLGVRGIARFSAENPDLGVLVLRARRENGRRVALVSESLRGRVDALAIDLDLRPLEDRRKRRERKEAALSVEGNPMNDESGGPRPIGTRRAAHRSPQDSATPMTDGAREGGQYTCRIVSVGHMFERCRAVSRSAPRSPWRSHRAPSC